MGENLLRYANYLPYFAAGMIHPLLFQNHDKKPEIEKKNETEESQIHKTKFKIVLSGMSCFGATYGAIIIMLNIELYYCSITNTNRLSNVCNDTTQHR